MAPAEALDMSDALNMSRSSDREMSEVERRLLGRADKKQAWSPLRRVGRLPPARRVREQLGASLEFTLGL